MLKCEIYKGENFFRDNIPVYINKAEEYNEKTCRLHRHDFIEIAYVYAGKGTHMVGSQRYSVTKGDLSIINYDIPHVFIKEDDPSSELTVYNCILKPGFIDYNLINSNDFKSITNSLLFNTFFIEDQPALNLKLSGQIQSETEEIYKKMYFEYNNMPKGYLNVLRACIVELLTKIFRYLETSHNELSRSSIHKSEIISAAIALLKENYPSAGINLNEVAIKTFLSRSYFSRIFKETTGENFKEYLQNMRISKACELLKSTDKKVTEILFDVGFKDVKHFNRLFKKLTGKTPSEYRRNSITS